MEPGTRRSLDFSQGGSTSAWPAPDHPDHATQGRLIRRYIAWRNAYTDDPKLRHVVRRANTVKVA